MEPTTKTYRSVDIRPRDKITEEKHQKELAVLQGKNERLRRDYDAAMKQLHEAKRRGNYLAESLGFYDIFEAQTAIDSAGHDILYRECLERLETLQDDLSVSKSEIQRLQDLLEALEKDQTTLRETLVASEAKEAGQKSTSNRLLNELKQLEKRYDTLVDVKQRAATRYKSDYAKWRRFRDWLFTEDAANVKDIEDTEISEEEKRRRYTTSIMLKKKMMMEIGPNVEEGDTANASGNIPTQTPKPPPLGGITNTDFDKENAATPTTLSRMKRAYTPASTARYPSVASSTTVAASRSPSRVLTKPRRTLRNRQLDSAVHATAPSSSPTLFNGPSPSNATRTPLAFFPIAPQVKQELGSSPSLIGLSKRQYPDADSLPGPSDTEGESQAVGNLSALLELSNTQRSPCTSPAPMASSQTEADSQSQFFLFPFPDLTPCPPHPSTPLSIPQAVPVPTIPPRPNTCPQPRHVVSRDNDSMQPTKMQRLNNEDALSPGDDQETPKQTPLLKDTLSLLTYKGKGKQVEVPLSTPANMVRSIGQKRLEDYSAFKGRGRYAKDTVAKDTINAQFEINPTRNGGLDFQYDEVVRSKDDRRRMDAGDCECCRDYYEAVGPLPDRLQAPLWRSPPNTPAKPCARHQHQSASSSKAITSNTTRREGRNRDSDITSHKQAISRHRYQWERAKTPPGYWDIGFPTTQETEVINEKAKEMHRQKRVDVEAAARKEDGRYRRRL